MWSPSLRSTACSIMANGDWTQAKLFAKHMVGSPLCKLCGLAHGTLSHRTYVCPVVDGFRRGRISRELRAAAMEVAADPQRAESFARAQLPNPAPILPAGTSTSDFRVHWVNRPPSGRLSGLVFADGSGFDGDHPSLRRAGWALAMTDRFGDLLAAAYGPVPVDALPSQTSKDGEDFAMQMAADLVEAPFQLRGDCATTVNTANGPAAWACRPGSRGAAVWGRWFSTHGGAVVVKVLAHATSVDVMEGRITEWERKGNAQADHYAKMGGKLHQHGERDRLEFLAISDLAQQAALASAEVTLHQASHSHCDYDEAQRAAAPRRRAPLLVVTGGPAKSAEAWLSGGPGGERFKRPLRPLEVQGGATGPPPHRLRGHSLVAAELLDAAIHPPTIPILRRRTHSGTTFRT